MINKTPDVFLSYSRRDKATAKRVCRALEAAGFAVFWDKQIPTGENWLNSLHTNIGAARCVLVLWSPHAVESKFVDAEARRGYDENRYFPVRIDKVDIPVWYKETQHIDLFDWDGADHSGNFPQLRDDLEKFLQARAAPVDEAPAEPMALIDRVFTKTVDRGDQIGAIEDQLGTAADRFCFVVAGCVEDWPEAFADFLTAHRARWSSRSGGGAPALEATIVRLLGGGEHAFRRALVSKVCREPDGGATQVANWVNAADGLRVVYATLDAEQNLRDVKRSIEGAWQFMKSLPEFAPGRSLVLLFGCMRASRNVGWLGRWRFNRFQDQVAADGCRRLPPLDLIRRLHIDTWVNGIPDELKSRYDAERLRELLLAEIATDKQVPYMELKPTLEKALIASRATGASR